MPTFSTDGFNFKLEPIRINIDDLDLSQDELEIPHDSIYVDPVILDVSVDDFVNECSPEEIYELIRELKDGGYLQNYLNPNIRAFGEIEFEKALFKLHDKWNMLSNTEENLIKKIANRLP